MHILYNARIFCDNIYDHPITALLIDHGIIKAAGPDKDILPLATSGDLIENIQGRTIWPGLIDAHIHLQHYALGLQKINCETNTLEKCLHRVGIRASEEAPGKWILGHGWNHNSWDGKYGNARDLDKAAPLNPVYLSAKSLHAAWVNSAALNAAGITADTPDPTGGIIQRDDRGNPTGILLESAALLVEQNIPQPTLDEITHAIIDAQTQLWKMGLTSVHDFDRSACFSSLQNLQANNLLKLRVLKSIPIENLDESITLGLCSGFGNDFLRIGPVKLFADGALGPRTAAMIEPYENDISDRGILMLNTDALVEIARKAVDNHFNLSVHAIGDRANHEVINAFEIIREYEKRKGLPLLRHRIEHVQILDPGDIKRLSRHSIIASMQPIHATSDMNMADQNWGSRSRHAYAWNSLLKAGTLLAFGSDAPVESPNPFLGLHAAVCRQRLDGTPGPDGWYPEQRLSLRDALGSYTIGPSFAAGNEKCQGRLLPGFQADLIVLPNDPFRLNKQEICNIEPDATMIAGEWVWQKHGDSKY